MRFIGQKITRQDLKVFLLLNHVEYGNLSFVRINCFYHFKLSSRHSLMFILFLLLSNEKCNMEITLTKFMD